MSMTPAIDSAGSFIDEMNRLTLERHGWIGRNAEKIAAWREEDRANGIVWEGDDTSSPRSLEAGGIRPPASAHSGGE